MSNWTELNWISFIVIDLTRRSPWVSDQTVHFSQKSLISSRFSRTLPGRHVQFPYLTVYVYADTLSIPRSLLVFIFPLALIYRLISLVRGYISLVFKESTSFLTLFDLPFIWFISIFPFYLFHLPNIPLPRGFLGRLVAKTPRFWFRFKFDSWSVNKDPTCLATWPKKQNSNFFLPNFLCS